MTTVRISQLRGTGGTGEAGEISLVGPATVLPNSTNTYTITDYDSFSTYSVSSTIGTATRVNEVVTLVIPTGASGDGVVLSITRNGSKRDFTLALGTQGVVTPSIISPQDGTINSPTIVTLQATTFATAPIGVGTHTNSQWQIARDVGFTDMVDSGTVTTGDKTRYTSAVLPRSTKMYARVQYVSNIGTSAWSAPISFTTTVQQINKPTVTIVGDSFDVGETPTFNSSPFSVTPSGSDTHVATSWVLRNSSDVIVWQLNNSSSNKLSVTIPRGVLVTSTIYTMEIQHIGGFGSSVFSDKLTFNTAQSFIPDTPGTPFGGGYYAGRINIGGQIYALVVAPKALGGEAPGTLTWKTSQTTTAGTDSVNDGWANTQAMATAGLANHPAAQFCRGLSIGGFNDWYLPAKDELEILYRNFKPTIQANSTSYGANSSSVPPQGNYTSGNPAKTSIALFKEGAAEAFIADWYWSSTQYSSSSAWYQLFNDGGQYYFNKSSAYYVRAIRKVLVS